MKLRITANKVTACGVDVELDDVLHSDIAVALDSGDTREVLQEMKNRWGDELFELMVKELN